MFEKEVTTIFKKKATKIAEKKVKEFYKECGWEDYKYMIPEFADVGTKCMQKGAEFGYDKANEWHKPSEKLPEECSLVLAYSFDDTEPSLWKFVTSDQWEWLPKRIVFCSNDQIRMWKEIVLPKGE